MTDDQKRVGDSPDAPFPPNPSGARLDRGTGEGQAVDEGTERLEAIFSTRPGPEAPDWGDPIGKVRP